ncbi:hypothetical protein [Aquibacillus saliphilus]|uniref:hypothetical protein n=1 Tax=Aquibacillus saliphilus TaxID=1909422 RepID=UPI001CF071B2|nr:hypothetical protein [Aquibacillus saliphilus]
MWGGVVVAALVGLVSYLGKEKSKEKDNQAEIGAEKIEDGYYWWNAGDLNDNENWIRLGPVDPIYYVNLTSDENFEKYHINIENELYNDPDPDTYYSCHSASQVEQIVTLLKKQYQPFGIVTIDQNYDAILKKIKY